jgi:hypothetical protein
MNAWEGQVLAIAVKELLEAFRTLGQDGFGRKNRQLLSSVIQDLLTLNPNITRAEATLKAYEALGAKPSPDLYIAKEMLASVKKRRLLENAAVPKGMPLLSAEDRAKPSPSTSPLHPRKRGERQGEGGEPVRLLPKAATKRK